MRSLICSAFEQVAADNADRNAVYGLSENLTRRFADLWSDFRTIVRALDDARLAPGACVVSGVGNRVAFVPLLLACLERRLSLVPLDGNATWPEILAVARSFAARAVVARSAAAEGAAAEGPGDWRPLPGGVSLMRCDWPDVPGQVPLDYGESVVLRLTSGSTDLRKAVVSSEANLMSDGRQIVTGMGIQPSDVSLGAIPISHAYGLGMLVMPLLMQGTAFVLRDGFVPSQLAHDIHTYGATVMPGVPFMFDYIRRLDVTSSPVSAVRLLVTAGAPIDSETVRFFKRTFDQKVHSLYGTSETGGITFDASEGICDSVNVGRPLPGTSVTLIPFPGSPAGAGRVHVRGDAVAAGYATPGARGKESPFTDGGFLAEDLARFDAGGNLVLMGRVSRFVNVAGRKVHPEEVERVLRELPNVIDASVIGMPCPTRGEMLVACVRRRGPVTATHIRSECSAQLAPHKIPRRIVFTEGLPTDALGKMDGRALELLVRRALIEEEEDAFG